MPVPQRCALLAIALGYCIAEFVIPTDYTSRTKRGIDWNQVMLKGAVCAVFAPIGYGLGELLTRRRKEEA
jgi:hypothetical protein